MMPTRGQRIERHRRREIHDDELGLAVRHENIGAIAGIATAANGAERDQRERGKAAPRPRWAQ